MYRQKRTLSQLRAISYSYSEKRKKERETQAEAIPNFMVAYKYCKYKTLWNALRYQPKTFESAKQTLQTEIDGVKDEIERATAKKCKIVYINQLTKKLDKLLDDYNKVSNN